MSGLMPTQWTPVFCVSGSVYALNPDTKEWTHRGTSGSIIIYQNPNNHECVYLQFEKYAQQIWWKLASSKLKPKGDRALVLKACELSTNQSEIIAIRFPDKQSSIDFAKTYDNIFQTVISPNTYQDGWTVVPSLSSHQRIDGHIEADHNTFHQYYRLNHCVPRPPPPSQPRRVQPPAPPRLQNHVMSQQNHSELQMPKFMRPYAHSEPTKPKFEHYGSWKCEVCTYQNQESIGKCSMCGLLKPQGFSAPNANIDENNKNKWECTICTYYNHGSMDMCEVCKAKNPLLSKNIEEQQLYNDYNPIPPKKYAPKQDPWNCPMCTLLNAASNARCDACNTARSNFPYPDLLNCNIRIPIAPEFDEKQDSADLYEYSVKDFERIAQDIAHCNRDSAISVFCTLRSVAKRLLKDVARYRTLDTTNPKVIKSLIGFDGVVDFLKLLGFESDVFGTKLICKHHPSEKVVHNALNALSLCIQQFRLKPGANHENATDGALDEFVNDKADVDVLTLEQIILWATHENMRNNETMETLIMTHKLFMDSLTLLKQLRQRFFVPIPPDILNTQNEKIKQRMIQDFRNKVQKVIQLKVVNALREWLKRYWSEDFHKNNEIQRELQEWLKELSVYPKLDMMNTDCVWISASYSLIKTEYLRQKQIDWDLKLEQQMDILSLFKHVDVGDIHKLNGCLGKLTAEELANQITLLDHQLFSRIKPRECIHQRWKDPNNKQLAPNILALIQQFNNFTIFIQIQILRETSLKKRGTAIKRIIKMGQHFEQQRNYNSLCAVFAALKSAAIHRLKLAWDRVPERYRNAFEAWLAIFCRDFNHRNLRQLLKKAGGNSCIPYIGVFLQDLIGIDEGNKKKVSIAAFNGNQLLNFNKYVRISERIKSLLSFQHYSYYSTIHKNEKIQKILLSEFDNLKNTTEDQLWYMSSNIKKNDADEAKQLLPFF